MNKTKKRGFDETKNMKINDFFKPKNDNIIEIKSHDTNRNKK